MKIRDIRMSDASEVFDSTTTNLEEADPALAGFRPLVREAALVQQQVHVSVACAKFTTNRVNRMESPRICAPCGLVTISYEFLKVSAKCALLSVNAATFSCFNSVI